MRRADEAWMSEAIALARRGMGRTRPNPPVGCAIVRQGRRVGGGYHRAAGKPHAEIEALRAAGDRARGADVYVSLEPCSTFGRTGPCTQALVQAGVKRVVVGARDPNPRHAGRGLRQLRAAGIEVQSGVCRRAATGLIEPFAKWITTGRPWVTLKLATTLDGAIADRTGRSRWITGAVARKWVDRLRSEVDAVMVGGATAVHDDPGLVPRGRRKPTAGRVVVDSRGQLPATAGLLNDAWSDLSIVATTNGVSRRSRDAWSRNGAAVWTIRSKAGRVSLPALVGRMGREGWLHVLCEGGGELATALLRERLVDELVVVLAPTVMGGASAIPAFGEPGWLLKSAPRFKWIERVPLGPDLLLRLRPERM